MKKIGILTFHRAENFGAVLQAFALQTYLRTLGYCSEIIDYRCKNVEIQYDIYNPRVLLSRKNIFFSLVSYFERFKNIKDRIIKKTLFTRFRKNFLKTSNIIHSKRELNSYDIIIVGSDQVWSSNITKRFDSYYFLDFELKSELKKIAYAASSEIKSYNKLVTNKSAIQALNKFDAISVRENQLKEVLQPFINKSISVTLDPTFLIPKEEYIKLASPIQIKDYVLVYHLYETSEGVKLAETLAKKKKLRIIEVHSGYGNWKDPLRHIQNAGPKELLGLILNADCIITTSFHGLALSLILEKDFWCINKGANTRLKNILEVCDLEQRMVNDVNDVIDLPINYREVQKKLDTKIQESQAFLKSSLCE